MGSEGFTFIRLAYGSETQVHRDGSLRLLSGTRLLGKIRTTFSPFAGLKLKRSVVAGPCLLPQAMKVNHLRI
jgi:hypothetical protein